MRSAILIVMLSITLAASPEQDGVEVAGLQITPGMSEAGVRHIFPLMHCDEVKDRGSANTDFCHVSSDGAWEGGGSFWFENGSVKRVTRNWREVDDLESYELLLQLYEILSSNGSGNGDGKGVCGEIYAYSQGPPSRRGQELLLVLPDRLVQVSFAKLGEEHRVSIRESTRINPVPASYPVGVKLGRSGICAVVD